MVDVGCSSFKSFLLLSRSSKKKKTKDKAKPSELSALSRLLHVFGNERKNKAKEEITASEPTPTSAGDDIDDLPALVWYRQPLFAIKEEDEEGEEAIGIDGSSEKEQMELDLNVAVEAPESPPEPSKEQKKHSDLIKLSKFLRVFEKKTKKKVEHGKEIMEELPEVKVHVPGIIWYWPDYFAIKEGEEAASDVDSNGDEDDEDHETNDVEIPRREMVSAGRVDSWLFSDEQSMESEEEEEEGGASVEYYSIDGGEEEDEMSESEILRREMMISIGRASSWLYPDRVQDLTLA